MRPIDADALKEIMCADCDNKHLCAESPACDTVREIDSMPTIEPKRGRWISTDEMIGYRCPVCEKGCDRTSNYCPNCGARMDEVKE